jgi:hypothetical protein
VPESTPLNLKTAHYPSETADVNRVHTKVPEMFLLGCDVDQNFSSAVPPLRKVVAEFAPALL